MNISFILPVFDDWDAVVFLLKKIDDNLLKVKANFHIYLVNDSASEAKNIEKIGQIKRTKISSIEIINLKKNLGHQSAIAIGLAKAHEINPSDFYIIMDSDGEDNPAHLEELIQLASEKKTHAIVAQRKTRKARPIFKICYFFFRIIFSLFTGRKIDFGNYMILPKTIVSKIILESELLQSLPATLLLLKSPIFRLPTKRAERLSGDSRMSFTSLVKLGITHILVFGDTVFTRVFILSSSVFFLTCVLIVYGVFIKFFSNSAPPGWASSFIAPLSLVSINLLILSLMAVFLRKGHRTTEGASVEKATRKFIKDITPTSQK